MENISEISNSKHLVVETLKNHSYFKKRFKAVIKERKWLIEELKSIDGVTVFPSDTNFILFKITNGESSSQIQNNLKRKGLLIKDRGKIPMLENCLRVTVGTRASNKRFLRELRRILS
ncbi:aminotransferase class I/II-fold pyridoxal phosphate-dependent enzyme [Thermoproteota archaeon]